MIDYNLIKELISKRLKYAERDYYDLPETDWEDGYNCALRFEIDFLTNILTLLEGNNERKGTDEDEDVGC
jgi:hypothetical protein